MVNLKKNKVDCFLSFTESYHDSNMYYLSRFLSADPFIYFKTPEKESIIVPQMEVERARKDCNLRVRSLNEFESDRDRYLGAIKELLNETGCKEVGVPRDFPLYIAQKLNNYKLKPIDLTENRAVKTESEINLIHSVQKTAEMAMKKAVSILKKSSVERNKLYYEDKPLTSDYIRYQINVELLKNDCYSNDTIVSSGRETSSPHNSGKGTLNPGPIIIDIFPKNRENRYCGDLTRSFSKKTDEQTRRIYQDVLEAQEAAFDLIKPGATGSEVHNAVCENLEQKGYETPRTNGKTGFIHSTGHGVGLDLHEHPRLSKGGGELKEGHVVTVEPGIYNPSFGGIRIEDLVVVEEDSCRNLTTYRKNLYI